jgi:hypothetical protein
MITGRRMIAAMPGMPKSPRSSSISGMNLTDMVFYPPNLYILSISLEETIGKNPYHNFTYLSISLETNY